MFGRGSADADMDRANARQDPEQPGKPARDFFFVNLFATIVIGLAVLLWIGWFTRWLDTAITLLGLGGILTWVAFLGKIVREERKTQLGVFLETILMRKSTFAFLLVVMTFLSVLSLSIGCIVADATADTVARVVTVCRAPEAAQAGARSAVPIRQIRLSPGSKRKLPMFTGFLGKTCQIEAEGLPRVEKKVYPWRRMLLDVPGSFSLRNLILVRPSSEVSQTSAKAGLNHEVVISVPGHEAVTMPFEGRALWIGCGREVAVPAALQEEWRLDLLTALLKRTTEVHPSLVETILARWFSPDAVEPIPKMLPGEEVSVVVRTCGQEKPLATASARVGRNDGRNLPQVIYVEKRPD